MLPLGRSMICLFLKSAARALSSVARVRAPVTIAKANTWGSLDTHVAAARRRCSSCRSLSVLADLRRPALSSTTSCRLTLSFFASSSRNLPAATRRGAPRSPKSQSMIALDCTRNLGATFASTMRHTSDTQKIALFFEEELPEARRRIGDAAVRIKFQVVNRGAGPPALEVKQRDVFGLQ